MGRFQVLLTEGAEQDLVASTWHYPTERFARSRGHLGHRAHLIGCDLLVTQRQGFLCFLVGDHVLDHRLGFAVLGDDQRDTLIR